MDPRIAAAVDHLRARVLGAPRVGVVLGSGLGDFADALEGRTEIPYAEIPGFPASAVVGHAGRLVVGRRAGVPVAVLSGRVHPYEGHPAASVVLPVRVLARWGCRTVVLTNAAGGVNAAYRPGDLMLIRDHLNLQGTNPLVGANDDDLGPRFPDMTDVYRASLRRRVKAAARAARVPLCEGVYAGLLGPSYETPAEIRMLRRLGADAVGMSTVLEAIALNHMGAAVVGISCITNLAAGVSKAPLDHEEVLGTTRRAKDRIVRLLGAVVAAVGAETAPVPPRRPRARTGGKGARR